MCAASVARRVQAATVSDSRVMWRAPWRLWLSATDLKLKGVMDNFLIDVRAEKKDDLRRALEIAFNCNAPGGKMCAYNVLVTHGLVIHWNKDADVGSFKLPAPFPVASAVDFVWSWLENCDRSIFTFDKDDPRDSMSMCPGDYDISTKPGFRVFCEAWGHVAGSHTAICAIKPASLWLGK